MWAQSPQTKNATETASGLSECSNFDTLPVFTVYWQAEWTGDRMVYHPDVYGLSFQQRAALKSF